MVEAARLGQLSTVRKLLDSGTATVEDRDEVSVCVRIYLLRYFKATLYGTNCVSFVYNTPHTHRVCACCVHACVSARLLLNSWTSLPCLHASIPTVFIRSHDNCGQRVVCVVSLFRVLCLLVGGDDSTVVGISRWSPVSGERVGERVQGECVSEEQGTSYSCTCHSTLQFVI